MKTTDKNGREYTNIANIKAGDKLELDQDFDCASGIVEVKSSSGRLYFNCAEGCHFLDGQEDDHGNLIGCYSA